MATLLNPHPQTTCVICKQSIPAERIPILGEDQQIKTQRLMTALMKHLQDRHQDRLLEMHALNARLDIPHRVEILRHPAAVRSAQLLLQGRQARPDRVQNAVARFQLPALLARPVPSENELDWLESTRDLFTV